MEVDFKQISNNSISDALEIYNWYVVNSIATFHLEPISQEELERMVSIGDEKYKSYLIFLNNQVCGFCYISQYRYKQAYDKSAEITLYLNQEFCGKGVGKKTLNFLEKIAKQNGINNLIAVITQGNSPSIKLFERAGYFKVGHVKNIGEKFGKTLDVLSYQKEI